MALLAAYGATLTTYNVLAARKKSKRQITVTVSTGFLTFGPELSEIKLLITVLNPGHRDVTLLSVGFLLPDKRQLVNTDPNSGSVRLPHRLTEGTQCMFWASARAIAEQLRGMGFSGTVNLTGFCRDAVDVSHFSKPFPFEVSEQRWSE